MKLKVLDKMIARNCDSMGCGHFGAPRGSRTHNGFDLVANVGDVVSAPFSGKITKYGYVYAGNYDFRYVEIQGNGILSYAKVRLMYVATGLSVGDTVKRGQAVGYVQDIAGYHGGGMQNHVHFELRINGALVNPEPLLKF